MSGSHSHATTISSKQLWVATTLTFAFCLGEAVVGYFSNSLALMADAGHNFADALALALSAFAIWMAKHRLTANELLAITALVFLPR